MCGIAGFLGRFEPALLESMGARIAHRGPDDSGVFFSEDTGIGLVHRRLSIIDLSPAGHQPMTSASGRYTICYNGEVYNYRELKSELESAGLRLRGHSDTEVILELFSREGVDCLSRLNGIFAFAIWDEQEKALFLARDGMGVKPLYLTRTPRGVAFASEIKALLAIEDLDLTLDPVAAVAYLSYLWSPGSRTMLRAVEKLEPGSWRRFGAGGAIRSGSFYRLPSPAPHARDERELIEGTVRALDLAVERQMVADVEVGAFLSGGLDSSAIVALARRHTAQSRLSCFTIDYAETPGERGEMISDLPYARQAAEHLGVELNEVRVDSSMAGDFEKLVYHLDEPQADPAALNSLYIAELARKNGVKVLLSGAGGDDLFTGYRRHQAARLDTVWDVVPAGLRSGLAVAASHLPTSPGALRRLRKLLQGVEGSGNARVARLFEWLSPEAAAELLKGPTAGLAAAAREPLLRASRELEGYSAVERTLRLDQRFFLTDHNLNYTDKTGMAHGVEIRVPFLDPDLVSWAAQLPANAKMRGGVTKWVLRKAMEPYLPHGIIYRPKTGFGVPLRAWMRGEMRPMVEDLLDPSSLSERGLFDAEAVQRLRADTESGRLDGSYILLGIMAIELWCRSFIDPSRRSKDSVRLRRRDCCTAAVKGGGKCA